jgi:tellurite resistance protein
MPMHPQDFAVVKSLVSVAWADGVFEESERQMLDGLLAAYRATPEQAEALRVYAAEHRSLDDIPIAELTEEDYRAVVLWAVILAHADNQFHPSERQLIHGLCQKFGIDAAEEEELVSEGMARAQRLVHLL